MFRRPLLWTAAAAVALLALSHMMLRDYQDLVHLLQVQALGADYSCFWAGARTALSDPSRLYDFRHVTALQGWPLGPHNLRPYIYPPSALFLFIPFALLPYWAGFAAWVAVTGALFLWAARAAGAPLWVALAPTVLLTADCGQVPFVMGALVIGALVIREPRPILAGVLLGVAACLKPQIVLLAPLALVAERRWRTLFTAGATGLVLCAAATLIWGVQVWFDWLGAMGSFRAVIFDNPRLVATAATPFAWLSGHGYPGAWAFLLAPLAAGAVWLAFRYEVDMADRLLAVFGGALLITPYAMNYELALLAPSVAIYLARWKDPRWPAYVLAAAGYLMLPYSFPALASALALPIVRRIPVARLRPSWTTAVFKS